MQTWIGCSGWLYEDWCGRFYPTDCPHSKWLDYYVTQFNTVEINSSFYRFPTENAIKKWYEKAPKHFRFSLKVPRSITHFKKFHDTKTMVRDFYDLCDLLDDKLGCVLFQLPPNLHYNEELLANILSQIDHNKQNVIEFRHSSWWQEIVYKALEQANIAFCSINAPKLPHDIVDTNSLLYLRMHGKKQWFRGHYNQEDLENLSKQIHQRNFTEVWIYFNNDVKACAPLDAKRLQKLF